MNRILIARELVRVAKDLIGFEFDTKKELQKYLKEHPAADKSLHYVKKKKLREKIKEKVKEKVKDVFREKKPKRNIVTPKGYGAWIRDDGTPVYVMDTETDSDRPEHAELLHKELGTRSYNIAHKKGWSDFRWLRNTLFGVIAKNPKVIDAVEDLIYFGKFERFEFELPNSDFSQKDRYLSTTDKEEALDWVRKHAQS